MNFVVESCAGRYVIGFPAAVTALNLFGLSPKTPALIFLRALATGRHDGCRFTNCFLAGTHNKQRTTIQPFRKPHGC